jgi:hypothetical protein
MMGRKNKFPCTIVNTGLFHTPLLDPFNPLKVKIVVEISNAKLTFLAATRLEKVLGSEPTAKISLRSIRMLTANHRRLEAFQRTLIRMGLVAAITFLWVLFIQRYGLRLSLTIALITACFIGPLTYLLNGGFSVKGNIFRFDFIREETGKPFYLDVAPEIEPELRQALRSVGLRAEEKAEISEELFCDQCGAAVDAVASKCPQCGAAFAE